MSTQYVMEHPRLATLSPGELNGIALKLAEELKELCRQDNSRDPRWFEAMRELQSLVPTGVYEHYKSTPSEQKLYTILSVSQCTEEPWDFVVTYSSQYMPFSGVPSHRPLFGDGKRKGFIDPVHTGITSQHRFRLKKTHAVNVLASMVEHPYLGPYRPGID